MQPLVSLLSVALLASVLSVRACIEDTYESMDIYDGMHIMGISPRSGQTVWTRSISVVAATLLPASDVFTLVNRRGWQFNTTLTYIDQNTAVVAPLTIPAFSSSPSQPFTLDFADSFTNRGVPVLEGRVRLTSDIFQNSFSFLTNFKYEVEFEFRPSAPLPPTIPLIGYGKGFTSVTPALPTPSTFTDHAFRLGMACFYNNGNAACLLAQLAEYVHTNVRSAGYKSTLCRGTPSFDAFGLNDGTRALSRILKAQYGEAPIAGKHGLMSVPLQTSSGTGSALTCGEQTVKAATDRSPIMHAQLAAGRALRDRIVSESGVVIDAEEHAGFPKPIPPIPSRLDFGALLTAEGKRIGIEVGVQRGLNLEALLLTWPTCELVFAVDPWDTQENYVDIANFNDQDAVFNEATRRLAPYGNVVLLRDYSPGVASQFPDGFFDYIYVDARHDYGSVLSDLLAFWPKLAKGGIMAGHDYQDTALRMNGVNDWHVQSDRSRHPEARAVKGAVLDFSTMVGRQLSITYEESSYRSWMLRK